MILLFVAVYSCLVSRDILAYVQDQRFRTGLRSHRNFFRQCDGRIAYNAFDSDVKVLTMVDSEMSLIKLMNSTSIKMELNAMGINWKGFADKSELEKALARQRVRITIRSLQESSQAAKAADLRANRIEDELSRIEASGMTELSIARELQALRVKFDVSEDLARKLAFARLNISSQDSVGDSRIVDEEIQFDDSKEFRETMTDLKGVYDRFVKNVEAVVPEVTKNLTAAINQQTVGEKLKTVEEYVRNIGLTASEQQAQIMASGSTVGFDGSTEGSSPPKNVDPLSESDILQKLSLADSLTSFDDVVRWAKKMSRSELAQLLIHRGEDVPQYAPRSTLAAILADSLLAARINNDSDDNFYQNSFTRNFVPPGPSSSSSSGAQIAPYENTSDSTRRRRTSSSADKIPRKKGYNDKREMSSFFFERELFTRFRETFLKGVENVMNYDRLTDMASGLSETPLTSGLTNVVALGCKAIITIAVWAAGGAMKPSHVVFVCAAYSIILRKGIWTFLASFAVIRILREIIYGRHRVLDPQTAAASI